MVSCKIEFLGEVIVLGKSGEMFSWGNMSWVVERVWGMFLNCYEFKEYLVWGLYCIMLVGGCI